eukprot:CAMPEP_0183362164 /NCGR_PEP_ID=MMETSP0164_2-20130417/67123_1 /TAXON_ID=221442 /ORGANISM="Coccolithus pelagicus ssp braarudi, Strain PLY182g" /LENGTH=42 /DNA_ID= /DNA_START= /DNA_END= /DNA_ORIENTATION=
MHALPSPRTPDTGPDVGYGTGRRSSRGGALTRSQVELAVLGY